MFTIYLITNKLNGKVYVGKTIKKLWKRWSDHKSTALAGRKTYLYDAMRCYGFETFDVVKIDGSDSEEELISLEKHYIKIFESHDPNKGYNLTLGGDGCSPTPETRHKMSESRKGKSPANKGKVLL